MVYTVLIYKRIFIKLFLLFFTLTCLNYSQTNISVLNIGLVYSNNSEASSRNRIQYSENMKTWELFLMNNRVKYHIISDSDLDNFRFKGLDVLILPSVNVISEKGYRNLRDFTASGSGLLITGNFGAFDESGKKRDKSIMRDLGGFEIERLSERPLPSVKHSLRANSIISGNMLAGSLFNIHSSEPVFKAHGRSAWVELAGVYPDFEEKVFATETDATGLVITQFGRGRILWFGFPIYSVKFLLEDHSPSEVLLNSLNFLAGNPVIRINNFPSEYKAAVITVNFLNNPDIYSGAIADYFISAKIFTENYFDGRAAYLYESQLRNLFESGSVNLLLDPQSADGSAADIIKRAMNSFSKISGKQSLALKTGEKQYRKLISEENISSLITEDNSLLIKSGNSYKGLNSCTNIFGYPDAGDRLSIINHYKRLVNKAVDHSSLLIVSVIDEFNFSDGTKDLGFVSEVFEYMKKQEFWFTNIEELSNWMDRRKNLIINFEQKNKNSFVLSIKNANNESIEDVSLTVFAGQFTPEVRLASNSSNAYLKDSDQKKEYKLHIPEIKGTEIIQFELLIGK